MLLVVVEHYLYHFPKLLTRADLTDFVREGGTGMLSHTTLAFHEVERDGIIYNPYGERNNYSESTVVVQKGSKKNRTYLFDIFDVLEAVPLFVGASSVGSEREISTYFPVDLRLARAVVDTDKFESHRVGRNSSSGWHTIRIDPALLQRK